jgi:UTP--glucose-1-phosphate uridylyltransferase
VPVRAVRAAVIPVAGLGTRMLPVTRAIPKGMLPVIDKPVVQYVVEEAAAAGLTDIVLVTGQDQDSFRAYFGPAAGIPVSFVAQAAPRGLGDAMLACAGHVGADPFALLLGDNILIPGDDLLTALIEVRNRYGGTILALTEIPPDEVSGRTVVAFEPTSDPQVVRVLDLTETPDTPDIPAGQAAPPSWIMIGRCVCDPLIFQVLRDTPPGHGGESRLSDALRALAHADPAVGGGVHGLLFAGHRLDTGNKQDYLRTIVEIACTRPDIAPQFLPWLRNYLDTISTPQPSQG